MTLDHQLGLLATGLAHILDGLTLPDIAALVGMLTALLGALVNALYTWRKDRREQRASDAAWRKGEEGGE